MPFFVVMLSYIIMRERYPLKVRTDNMVAMV